MIEVIVAAVKDTKNIYYLSPGEWDLKKGDKILINTENGICIAHVIKENYKEKKENLLLPLDKVIRKCTQDDVNKYNENQIIAEKALKYAKKSSNSLNLEMNFVDAFYNFDKSQLIFSFLAENRVDFRDLAKKIAQKYKTRIELRQIGVRDKAKRIGGLGPCGLFLCCNSFLTDFSSVSINMAKNQYLALNPSKINGVCGRLLCCLGYENDTYTNLKSDMPSLGFNTDTPMGIGKVIDVDIFRKTYKVELKNQEIIELSKED